MSNLLETSVLPKKKTPQYCIGTPADDSASLKRKANSKAYISKSRRANISRTWANTSLSKSRVLSRSLHSNNRTLAKKLNAVQVDLAKAHDTVDSLRDENESLRQKTRFKDARLEEVRVKLGEIARLLFPLIRRVEESLRGVPPGPGDTFSLDTSLPFEDMEVSLSGIPDASLTAPVLEELQNPFLRRDRIPRTPTHSVKSEESSLNDNELSPGLPSDLTPELPPSFARSPPVPAVLKARTSPPPLEKNSPTAAVASPPKQSKIRSPPVPALLKTRISPPPLEKNSPSVMGASPPKQCKIRSPPVPALLKARTSPPPLENSPPVVGASLPKQRKVHSHKNSPVNAKTITKPVNVTTIYDFSLSETMNQTHLPPLSLQDLRAEAERARRENELKSGAGETSETTKAIKPKKAKVEKEKGTKDHLKNKKKELDDKDCKEKKEEKKERIEMENRKKEEEKKDKEKRECEKMKREEKRKEKEELEKGKEEEKRKKEEDVKKGKELKKRKKDEEETRMERDGLEKRKKEEEEKEREKLGIRKKDEEEKRKESEVEKRKKEDEEKRKEIELQKSKKMEEEREKKEREELQKRQKAEERERKENVRKEKERKRMEKKKEREAKKEEKKKEKIKMNEDEKAREREVEALNSARSSSAESTKTAGVKESIFACDDAAMAGKENCSADLQREARVINSNATGLKEVASPDEFKARGKRRFKRIVTFDDSLDESLVIETPKKIRKQNRIEETPLRNVNADSESRAANGEDLGGLTMSARGSRRAKPMHFREPNMRDKLRRGDAKWCRDQQ